MNDAEKDKILFMKRKDVASMLEENDNEKASELIVTKIMEGIESGYDAGLKAGRLEGAKLVIDKIKSSSNSGITESGITESGIITNV